MSLHWVANAPWLLLKMPHCEALIRPSLLCWKVHASFCLLHYFACHLVHVWWFCVAFILWLLWHRTRLGAHICCANWWWSASPEIWRILLRQFDHFCSISRRFDSECCRFRWIAPSFRWRINAKRYMLDCWSCKMILRCWGILFPDESPMFFFFFFADLNLFLFLPV